MRKARRTGLPHNQARLVFQREIVGTLAQRLVDQMEAVVFTETGEALDGGSADGRLSEADLRALAAAGVVLGAEDDAGPRRPAGRDRQGRAAGRAARRPAVSGRARRAVAAADAGAGGGDLLGRDAWSAADIPLLDEAAALVGESVPSTGTWSSTRRRNCPKWTGG